MKGSSLRLLTLLTLSTGLMNSAAAQSEDAMKLDVTIYVSAQLIESGGTVIVVPYTTDNSSWPSDSSRENPAADDPTLSQEHPLQPNDRRIGVLVAEPINIVRFNVPENGTYSFRFRPAPDARLASDAKAPRQIGSGSSTETDPRTGITEEFPTILTFHIPGRMTDEGKSREARARTRLGSLETRYECRVYEGALSCDGTRDLLDG